MSVLKYTLAGLPRAEQRRTLWQTLPLLERGSAWIVGNVLFVLTHDNQTLNRVRQQMQRWEISQFMV
ncbi:hypothetical protein D5085_07210 [Ectothiorhodospiraceae bacterium BW-2]|nr:hypothetical protein D5085_07210 [Ectothiorhodospiraceae bacterium BW-2]